MSILYNYVVSLNLSSTCIHTMHTVKLQTKCVSWVDVSIQVQN